VAVETGAIADQLSQAAVQTPEPMSESREAGRVQAACTDPVAFGRMAYRQWLPIALILAAALVIGGFIGSRALRTPADDGEQVAAQAVTTTTLRRTTTTLPRPTTTVRAPTTTVGPSAAVATGPTASPQPASTPSASPAAGPSFVASVVRPAPAPSPAAQAPAPPPVAAAPANGGGGGADVPPADPTGGATETEPPATEPPAASTTTTTTVPSGGTTTTTIPDNRTTTTTTTVVFNAGWGRIPVNNPDSGSAPSSSAADAPAAPEG
jgi:hypothetical protein